MAELRDQNPQNKCSICLNYFQKPKTITCGHEFCEKCLKDNVSKNSKNEQFPCPLCRELVAVPIGGVDQFPDGSLEGAEENCGFCKNDEQESTFYCADCDTFACVTCKPKHDLLYLNHKIENKDNCGDRLKLCREHKSQKLDFYCKDCCKIICVKGLSANHKDHDTRLIDDHKAAAVEELGTLKGDLDKTIAKYKQYIIDVNTQMSVMDESLANSCSLIDDQIKQIKDNVNVQGEELQASARDTFTKARKKNENLVSDTKNVIWRLEGSLTGINNILEGGSAYKVLNILPQKRKERDDNVSHTLAEIPIVTISYTKGQIIPTSLGQMIGCMPLYTGDVCHLRHTFNDQELKGNKNTWFYSPVYRIHDISFYLRARYKIMKTSTSPTVVCPPQPRSTVCPPQPRSTSRKPAPAATGFGFGPTMPAMAMSSDTEHNVYVGMFFCLDENMANSIQTMNYSATIKMSYIDHDTSENIDCEPPFNEILKSPAGKATWRIEEEHAPEANFTVESQVILKQIRKRKIDE